MYRPILFGVALLWAMALIAQSPVQPLNVKTGLWEVTETSTVSGLPPMTPQMQARMEQMTPEQRARMEAMMKSRLGGAPRTTNYRKCVTASDLHTNAFTNGPDEKCNWTVLTSTGSVMEVRGTGCAAGRNQGMETDLNLKISALDSENVRASMRGTSAGNGNTINFNGTFTGKWVSASCPAGAY